MKKFLFLFFTIVVLNFGFNFVSAATNADTDAACVNVSGCDGVTCKLLPKCEGSCRVGCQPGFYLSDGDGNHYNNCLKTDANGNCIKSNLKGVCEVCPPGFYCAGGIKDKVACAEGTFRYEPGAVKASDCKAVRVGFCTARAEIQGHTIVGLPSVCLKDTEKSTPNTGVVDELNFKAVNSKIFQNDDGLYGYTKGKFVGANIEIPCPVGMYQNEAGKSFCKYPSAGYCSSRDGKNCSYYDAFNVGGEPNGNGKKKDFNPKINPDLKYAAVSQVKCPLGTYDKRTTAEHGKKPNAFCVFPDVGQKTGSSDGAVLSSLSSCAVGNYDSRWSTSDKPVYCSSLNPSHSNCKISSDLYKFTPYSIIDTFIADQPQAECASCPAGTYQDETGKAFCKYPLEGKYASSTGLSNPVVCPAGSYDSRTVYDDATKTFIPITNTVIGTSTPLFYSSGKVHTSCTICPVGTYQNETGKTICKYPDAGYYANSTSSQTQCASGRYDSRPTATSPYDSCAYPQAGYCTSSDGFACSNTTGLTKQVFCPVGTYDARTDAQASNTAHALCSNPPAGSCVGANDGTSNTSCNLSIGSKGVYACPVGTYDNRNGSTSSPQSACSNPGKQKCSSIDNVTCSMNNTGARYQISCGAETMDTRTSENLPHKECEGCLYNDWQITSCNSSSKLNLYRTPNIINNNDSTWYSCSYLSDNSSGSCRYCTNKNQCNDYYVTTITKSCDCVPGVPDPYPDSNCNTDIMGNKYDKDCGGCCLGATCWEGARDCSNYYTCDSNKSVCYKTLANLDYTCPAGFYNDSDLYCKSCTNPGVSSTVFLNANNWYNPGSATCDFKFDLYTYNGHKYAFSKYTDTFNNSCGGGCGGAYAKCLEMGANMVIINDLSENNFIDSKLKGNTWLGLSQWWSGGTSASDPWKIYPTSTAASYLNWASGEPNNSGGSEDCANIFSNSSGKWNDANCTSSLYFICEWNSL